jgi:hypothetical protein
MSALRRFLEKRRRMADPLRGLDEQQWLARHGKHTPWAVAVVEPEWRGVYSSTVNLFPTCLPVLDGVTKRSAARIAELIVATGTSRVVFAEIPPTYLHLLDALAQAPRKIDVYVTWYNSFMMSSARSWTRLKELKQLVAEKRVRKIGFAKSGMAEVFRRQNIPASLVLHGVPKVPTGPSVPLAGGPHLGVAAVNLAIWRKLPFAMLAATTEIPGAVVHVAGGSEQVEDFARELQIDARIRRQPVPQTEIAAHLASMHLNLYVTLSECCPMLPLESLAEGTPCLLGPNSHLFDDSAFLHSRLVVEYPERNEIIAHYIRQALAERDDIVAAYRRWAPKYWQRVQESLGEFLDMPGVALDMPVAA